MTTPTKSADPGKGGTVATEGNKSPTTVATGAKNNSPAASQPAPTSAVGAKTETAPAATKVEVASEKTAASASSDAQTSGSETIDETMAGFDKANAEFEKALNEPDTTGDIKEADLDEFDRRENGGKTREELIAERDALDAQIGIVSRESESAFETVSRQQKEHENAELNAAFNKLVKIDSVVLPSTPDSHTAWGVGGVILTLGDIRRIARAYVKNGSRV